MIGIGVDMVDIKIFRRLLRDNTASWKTYFSGAELTYCTQKSNPAQHLAVRFAAKEAIIKALSRFHIVPRFDQVEVVMRKNRPAIRLQMRLQQPIAYDVSLTHTATSAFAVAVAIKQ